MDKLKSINWKGLIIDHGEKVVLGMALIFVLVGVATTRWGTYERSPEDFDTKIRQGQTTLAASRWPAEKQKEYEAQNPGDLVAGLLDGTPQGLPLFQYSTKWVWPIRKRKAKLREPEMLPATALVADAATMLIMMQPETKSSEAIAVALATTDEIEAADSAVPGTAPAGPQIQTPRIETPRTGTNAGNGIPGAGRIPGVSGGSGAGAYPGAMEGYPTAGGGAGKGSLPAIPGIGGPPGGLPGGGNLGMGIAQGNMQGPAGEALGMRFVAVRGVIPTKLIVGKFAQALNLDTPQEAYQQVQFWDFELERQTATPGADPWKGAWETVVIEDTLKLLDRLEFDLDIVAEQYRDPVFTMPLPYRVTGSWDQSVGLNGLIASHPLIKKILTKQEQLQAEVRALATLKVAEMNKEIKQQRKSGFAHIQHDTGGMQAQMGGSQDSMNQFNQAMQEVMEEEGMEGMAPPTASGQPGYPGMAAGGYPGGNSGARRVVTIPESLLFRFLDFSVVPGNAYRYRLRLKMLNPNFDRDPAELLDVSSREGKFRDTPWSIPSTPAVVKEETNLFVKKVDERRGVSMDAYKWLTDTGMYVNGLFEGLQRAERVAAWTSEKKSRRGETTMEGGVFTEVLRPAHETFGKERIDYVTPHSLIDFERTSVINPDEFPDLELSSKRVSIVLEEVVTINRFGELQHIDTDSQSQGYQGWKNYMTAQGNAWQHLRRVAQPTGGIAGLLGSAEGEEDDTPRRRGRRSSSQKRGIGQQGYNPYGGGGADAYGAGQQLPPGYPSPSS
jgi:hypothetical protein